MSSTSAWEVNAGLHTLKTEMAKNVQVVDHLFHDFKTDFQAWKIMESIGKESLFVSFSKLI